MKNLLLDIPKEIKDIANVLEKAGYDVFFVGGSVRDILMGNKPKDWDITTNATPEEIICLYPKSFYENDFGTVGVVNENVSDETLRTIQITPYRKESLYSDFRHPDTIEFTGSIEEDLGRRDFTINAMALSLKGEIVDPFGGLKSLEKKEIKTVGNPNQRFLEDALRVLRAIRLAAELGFMINIQTLDAIKTHATLLSKISKERIRDEFIKIVSCKTPSVGFQLMKVTGVLAYVIPELTETFDIGQNQAHSFDVWEHTLKTLNHAAKKDCPLDIRLAALFHDIGKPRSRRWGGEKKDWTFYGHDVVGTKMTKKILENLKFPKKEIETVAKLVRWHMFFSDTEKISLSAVRRIIANVGKENIWSLMKLREADRIGTGRPKENPYRLRKYKSMIEEALHDPISVGMLKINGDKIMKATDSNSGPKIGHILHILLEEVLDDPAKNNEEYLIKRTLVLDKLSEKELKKMGEVAKEKKEKEEEEKINDIRKKHWVK